MKVEHINPFVECTKNVFETVLGTTATHGRIRRADPAGSDRHDVTALIGLSGTAKGVVEMSFPGKTAVAISNKMQGADCTNGTEINDDVVDALGEVVNMIAGGAKAKFDGHKISISLPTVIKGKDHSLNHPTGTVSLAIPFSSELGEFVVCVSFSTS
ncbi:MAG: chemotaxis protein CheX [Planctomycetota bacterium]|nr:MAG: chemotaxis protein CheX [Planctomycetota bacterium]